MSWNGEDLFKAVLLGGGSGGSSGGGGGGLRLVQGTVTVAETAYKLLLYETDELPDFLYLTYTPEQNEINTSSNKVWACMLKKTGETDYISYNYAYINGTRFLPSINEKSASIYQPFIDGCLAYPYNQLTMQFAAGQTIQYTAIYTTGVMI